MGCFSRRRNTLRRPLTAATTPTRNSGPNQRGLLGRCPVGSLYLEMLYGQASHGQISGSSSARADLRELETSTRHIIVGMT